MAAGKKKKKPAVNLARGFAITSTPSKPKSQNTIDDQSAPDPTGNKDEKNSPVVAPVDVTSNKQSEKLVPELNPDQLEKQLEDSDLLLLVEKYGESVKKSVFRQVSKLRTERRLLRAQADHLRTRSWLPFDLIELVIDRLTTLEKGKGESCREPGWQPHPLDLIPDDVLIKVWSLHQLLPQLGFSDFQRENALRELLQREQAGIVPHESGGKDYTWGLSYCLDWFARSADSGEAQSYDESKSGQHSDLGSEVLRRDKHVLFSATEVSRSESPSSQREMESRAASPDVNPADSSPQVSSETESDIDSDLEPHEMVSKYLALKTRHFHLSPASEEQNDGKGKKPKPQTSSLAHDRSRTARLDSKIAKIRSDILFDQQEADRQWSVLRIDLVRETANRRRLGVDDKVEDEKKHGKSEPNGSSSAAEEVEEEASMLGELLSGLPDTAPDGGICMRPEDPGGALIKVRNFGKWNGMSPRRILEEACRARSLSETTFSSRHRFHVQWSRPQEMTCPPFIDGVTCGISISQTSVRMDTVSCPTALQSEAYVSTIALFAIFASSAKEEKAHLRLPPVWRDVWEDLRLLKKHEAEERDMNTLRELRALIAAQKTSVEINEAHQVSKKDAPTREVAAAVRSSASDNHLSAMGAEVLRSLWTSHSSTSFYHSMLDFRKSLPIWKYKQDLLHTFEENQITIVCGETGCGKSTQVPAYILENELSGGRSCKIYCTEPRRISAVSLARRVSEELGEKKGDIGTSRSLVGFAVRLDSQMTGQTRLVYATTGIVMRMLESDNGLEEVTHLVIDEVHERSIETDFLLIVLRKLVVRRPTLRVVLMSATVDAERFSRYLDGAPVLIVPGRTFPVETKFLEDAVEATNFQAGGASAGRAMEEDEEVEDDASAAKTTDDRSMKLYSLATRETLANFNEYQINYDLILKLLQTIATSPVYAEYSKAILVFLPGIAEIRRLHDMLVGSRIFAHKWNVFPLHSTIATEEQEKAFLIPPPGLRKIVIATNIAETGITIPDVTCVIDTGKHKEMRFDERRQLSRLIESFISKANAKQRRGRAGRVQKGLCFHLYTKYRHDSLLPDQQTPEMLRLSLQDLVLRVKICKLGGIEQTLTEALDPPSAKNVRRAIDALIDVKALTAAEDLTPLGRQLASLPLDVFLGKLILLGSIFGCLDSTLSIAAVLSSKSPFSAPLGARAQADLARMAFKKGDSDLLTTYNAYCAWRRICSSIHGMSEQQFCRKNFLNAQTLANIEELKSQLLLSLVDANFVTITQAEKQVLNRVRSYSRQRHFVPVLPHYNGNTANDLIVNAIIASSFYPKLLKREGKGWRNVANNQWVSLHPTSVNKSVERPPQWLSFYHIMQSSNKFYNAHETSAVEDFAIVLLCGDAEFKMYSGVIVIDGNRIKFAVDDWKKMLAIKTLRTEIRDIMMQVFKNPRKELSEWQKGWLDIWQRVLTIEETK